ncbi:MAG: Polysaccharide export protein [Verrucomicrobiales bacterium]|jgi:polysaccharide export outer membrane protein|nr:Polysaccharide export protein [Verrucomicrobiales bacterium]MDB6130773.1 Polysaccharide export protein [Verrucomicrobiales bacterium]
MRKQWVIVIGVLVLTIFGGCKAYTPGPKFDPRAATLSKGMVTNLPAAVFTNRVSADLLQPGTNQFRLGPGDKMEIEFMDDVNSRTLTTVGPDGKIYFGILPGIDVWGMTLPETQAALEKAMGKFEKNPQRIGITLRGIESQYIWLLGRLNSPGTYPMVGPTTLLEALSYAGGTLTLSGNQDPAVLAGSQELADLNHSFVLRKGQVLPVDFQRLLQEGDLSQNIYLQPDDFVYVPSAANQAVYVMGAVGEPRSVPYNRNLTLVGAITRAYGTIPDAHTAEVALVRGSLANPRVAMLDYKAIAKGQQTDILLEPHDIIYVSYTPWRILTRYADTIAKTFASSVAINEGTRAVFKTPPQPAGIFIPAGSAIQIVPNRPLPR